MKNKDKSVFDGAFNNFSVSFENLLNLPCYVFLKNKKGIYLGYNDYGAANLGYKNGDAITNKDDYEIFPHEMAEIYRKNDHTVITEQRQLFAPEKGVLKDNYPIIFLSYKMPLYDKYHEPVGIFGLAFARHLETVTCSNVEILSPIELAQICNSCPQKYDCNQMILSEKEKLCVEYLCQGLTLKMIARQLKVSPKTIETHIERAKIKMNCHNKAQLILAFIKNYGYSSY